MDRENGCIRISYLCIVFLFLIKMLQECVNRNGYIYTKYKIRHIPIIRVYIEKKVPKILFDTKNVRKYTRCVSFS